MVEDSRITVRPAVAGDAAAIGAVFNAAVRTGWNFLGQMVERPMFPPEYWDQLVVDHQPPDVLVVADHGTGGVVGYCAAHPDDGELHLLFVHPDHGGRGIGGALLTLAHDALRSAGCSEAYLFTHERNVGPLGFYASVGYRPDGTDRTADFHGTTIRELRLVAPLEPATPFAIRE